MGYLRLPQRGDLPRPDPKPTVVNVTPCRLTGNSINAKASPPASRRIRVNESPLASALSDECILRLQLNKCRLYVGQLPLQRRNLFHLYRIHLLLLLHFVE